MVDTSGIGAEVDLTLGQIIDTSYSELIDLGFDDLPEKLGKQLMHQVFQMYQDLADCIKEYYKVIMQVIAIANKGQAEVLMIMLQALVETVVNWMSDWPFIEVDELADNAYSSHEAAERCGSETVDALMDFTSNKIDSATDHYLSIDQLLGAMVDFVTGEVDFDIAELMGVAAESEELGMLTTEDVFEFYGVAESTEEGLAVAESVLGEAAVLEAAVVEDTMFFEGAEVLLLL